jgi:hypothetical protein
MSREELQWLANEYCYQHGLDPARTSVEFRPDGSGGMTLAGHHDLGPEPGFRLGPVRPGALEDFAKSCACGCDCCCGVPR